MRVLKFPRGAKVPVECCQIRILAFCCAVIMSDWEEECESPASYGLDISSSFDYRSSRSCDARGGKLWIIYYHTYDSIFYG